MERNILIVELISTMVIIILSSFTTAVGTRSIESQAAIESPLFQCRTQKSIHLYNQDRLDSEYLGKRNDRNIMFSPRVNSLELIHDVISSIKLMDDNTFKKFVKTIVHKVSEQENTDELDINEIISELYQLRVTSKTYMGEDGVSDSDATWLVTPTLCWFPGCILILGSVFVILTTLLFIYATVLTILNAQYSCMVICRK